MKPSAALAALTIAALASICNVAHAQAREAITWYISDFPPNAIHDGPDKGKGNNDLALQDFIARLPQYDHKMEEAVTTRILDSLAHEPSSCTLQLVKNAEREKTIAYSTRPHVYVLPNAMVILRKHLDTFKPFMNGAGEIRLEEALASGKIKVAVSKNRSYGAAIDPVLKMYPNVTVPLPPNIKSSLGIVMRKLESHDEFDAGFGYATELNYLIKSSGLNAADYLALPVAGSSLVPLPVACSKTDSGRRILAEIDKILADPALQQTFDARYKSWLDPAVVPYYDEMLKQARKNGK